MSFSIDDLANSFSSSHIGQEALDLAALQAQLKQSLFCNPPSSSSFPKAPRGAPLNSPVARTPSSSMSWEGGDAPWPRHTAPPPAPKPRRSMDDRDCDMDDDEDERMVEDLLTSPASPTSATGTYYSRSSQHSVSAAPPHRARKQSLTTHMIPLNHSHVYHDLPAANTSLFTTTDPFYVATHAQQASYFGHGPGAQHSSSFLSHPKQAMYGGFGHQDVQQHNFFATATAFTA